MDIPSQIQLPTIVPIVPIQEEVIRYHAEIPINIGRRHVEPMLVGWDTVAAFLGVLPWKAREQWRPFLSQGGFIFYRSRKAFGTSAASGSKPLVCSFPSFTQMFLHEAFGKPYDPIPDVFLRREEEIAAGLHIGLRTLTEKWLPTLLTGGFVFREGFYTHYSFESLLHAAIVKYPHLNSYRG